MDEDRDAATAFHKMKPYIFDGTQQTISLPGWLFDMDVIFRVCHIEAHLQVLLASRCLMGEVRAWWMAQGDQAIHGTPWADFRARMIARYGPPPIEGANAPYRDPAIYGDMNRRRYLNFAAEWHAYPDETMGHYCRRFREAMLPYIPQELVDPQWRALQLIRDGLPPAVKFYVPAPVVGISLEDMIDAIMEAEVIAYMVQEADPVDVYQVDPVDDAGIPEPVFEGVPVMPEDPIPVVPLQQIPPQEAEAGPNDDGMDPAEAPDNPGDNAEDPPVILIESDDEEPEVWEEWDEFEDIEEELDDPEEQEEDPEEMLFDDEDRDVFSDAMTE